jgi:ABC-type transport system substrate-binding protein
MTSLRRFTAGASLAAAAALVLAACTTSPSTPGSPGSSGSASSSLTIGINANPPTFDPLISYTAPTQQVTGLIYDALVATGPDNQIEPRLASSYTVSPDAKTVTFHLRPGMKWSDGKPFTSADVVYTYNVYANPKAATPNLGRLSDVAGFQAVQSGKAKTLSGLTAPDSNTVVFQLSKPDAGWVSLIAWGITFPILPQHILGSIPDASLQKASFWNDPKVGMGPYNFVSFTPNSEITLKKNPYFRTPAKIGTIFIKIVTSQVAASEIGSGELDLAQIQPQDYGTVKGFPGVTVASALSPGFNRLAINVTKPYMKNVLVRQALMYAIDRAGIVSTVYKGLAKILNTSFMTPWAIPQTGLNPYPYDPAKAKQLLKEAHWNPATTLTFVVQAGRSDWAQTATIITANLKAVGINVKEEVQDPGAVTADLNNKSFDFILYDGGSYPMDPDTVFPTLACADVYPAGGNISYFCNHQLDTYMGQGQLTSNQSARAVVYQKAALLANQQVPMIYLNIEPAAYGMTSKLQGFVASGDYTNAFIEAASWSLSG